MVLWLSENEVEMALPNNVAELISRLDSVYSGDNAWVSFPRTRIATSGAGFQYMGARCSFRKDSGAKSLCSSPRFGTPRSSDAV